MVIAVKSCTRHFSFNCGVYPQLVALNKRQNAEETLPKKMVSAVEGNVWYKILQKLSSTVQNNNVNKIHSHESLNFFYTNKHAKGHAHFISVPSFLISLIFLQNSFILSLCYIFYSSVQHMFSFVSFTRTSILRIFSNHFPVLTILNFYIALFKSSCLMYGGGVFQKPVCLTSLNPFESYIPQC